MVRTPGGRSPDAGPVEMGKFDAALDGQARARGRDVARTTDKHDLHRHGANFTIAGSQGTADSEEKKQLPFS